MSLLRELESMKYSAVIDLIKRDEVYDKKRSVITGEEAFRLCHARYQAMQDLLLPLKNRLGKNIEITDISFAHGMQDDTNIVVKYNDNGKASFFTITNSDFNDIEIVASNNRLEKYGFIMANKGIILDIFNKIYVESLDSEFYLNSTSKKFIIKDNCKAFTVKDNNERIFSIETNHFMYSKSNTVYNKDKVICAYQILKEMLLDENNILNIYQHIHVYEEDFPKILIKKTN